MADKQRFNQEMDAYIRSQKQKQKGSVDIAVDKKNVPEQKTRRVRTSSGMIVEYDESDTLWDRILDFFVGGYEEEPEPQQPREELTAREKKKLAKMQGSDVDVEDVPDDDFEDYEEDLDVPQPTFFDKLLQFFGVGEEMYGDDEFEEFDPNKYADEEADNLMWEEDVKEIMQITHRWIEKLPADKKKEFKNSEDFERYRELLDKLNLLKK